MDDVRQVGDLQLEELWNKVCYERQRVQGSDYIGILYGHWGTEHIEKKLEVEGRARKAWLASRDALFEAGGHPIAP